MSQNAQIVDRIQEIRKELDDLEEENLALGARIHLISEELGKIQLSCAKELSNKVKLPKYKERKITLQECRGLIGHQVRIINPSSGEGDSGTITKVQKLYVTVTLPDGTQKRRIASNLRAIE